jgi:hypothetical protein
MRLVVKSGSVGGGRGCPCTPYCSSVRPAGRRHPPPPSPPRTDGSHVHGQPAAAARYPTTPHRMNTRHVQQLAAVKRLPPPPRRHVVQPTTRLNRWVPIEPAMRIVWVCPARVQAERGCPCTRRHRHTPEGCSALSGGGQQGYMQAGRVPLGQESGPLGNNSSLKPATFTTATNTKQQAPTHRTVLATPHFHMCFS